MPKSALASSLRSDAIAALRTALPYLSLYQGKTFVVKVGGEAFVGGPQAGKDLIEQVGVLHRLGMRVVLVHGGGPQASALTESLGGEPIKIEGRRVTDPIALRATTLALNGEVATHIVALGQALQMSMVTVSGVSAGMILAHQRPPTKDRHGNPVDYGLVGDVDRVDVSYIETILAAGHIPVVSPLGVSKSGQVLNLNADGVAAELAIGLGAAKMVFLTGAPGILRDAQDPSSLISFMDLKGLADLESTGAVQEGMWPKSASIRRALEGGVERVHVVGQNTNDGLLKEVFTNEGSGTLIVREGSHA
ncbi:MAG TPA: acetylglutamate kinase [Fimbriimonadaceae bacterium]|nr:acetylglutamate kinase [Fimbriimonadaceae bacterium]HRE92831.1 acetylglutamate kinase [Fimbriimonadaceae bacterium]HRI74893.1 acetylglutamate kinase [Fimbriimonadaceae bacterium]